MLKVINHGLCLLALGLFLGFASAHADNPTPAPTEHVQASHSPVTASLLSENDSVQPGHPFWVAIHLKMDEHWHAYWKNPGDAGMAPIVKWTLPEGFTAGEILWATPKRFNIDNTVGFGYEDETVLLVQITPPASYTTSTVKLAANVRWVVCSDSTCLPGKSPVSLELPVVANAPTKNSANTAFFSAAREKVPQNHDRLAARHDDALIELSFQNNPGVQSAEFFPEQSDSINYTIPPLFEASDTPGKYTLVFEELTPQEALKGILVLHTGNESQAFLVDVPVTTAGRDSPIASRDLESAALDSTTTLGVDESHQFEGSVDLAIALAFLGGMILNLMPCVLPVISFKILGFINLAGKQRRLIFKHGVAFSGGVLLSFWIIAALLLGLQAYGRSVGWGFQLQEPLFVAALAAFIFVFGLSLFGLFEIGTSVMSKAGEVQQSTGKSNLLLGSFMSGILATAVATPCTGPFLGSTVGFAVTLPPMEAMLIFTSVGLGMAFPYLALSTFPSLLRFLPKPGNWMIAFKELMGFLMMASVIWLIWVFSAQTGTLAVSIFLSGLLFLTLACWIWGRWASPICSRAVRTCGIIAATTLFILGGYTIYSSTSQWALEMDGAASKNSQTQVGDVWEEFSPERVAELRKKGIPVFIDFTAKWCLICQANHAVLSTSEVAEKFAEKGVVRMKADWTRSDEMIAAELKKFGRNSVPLYVLYGVGTEAEILPQLLTPENVVEALDKIKTKR